MWWRKKKKVEVSDKGQTNQGAPITKAKLELYLSGGRDFIHWQEYEGHIKVNIYYAFRSFYKWYFTRQQSDVFRLPGKDYSLYVQRNHIVCIKQMVEHTYREV